MKSWKESKRYGSDSKLQSAEQHAFRQSIHDYFATPEPITKALLRMETFDGLIWEPACGEGWMAEVLKTRNEVLATDLINRGYGTGGVDFLTQTQTVPNIVTNPPYIDDMWYQFTAHALRLATNKVAMLLPLWSLETLRFLRLPHLKAFYPFLKRVSTVPGGNRRLLSAGGKSLATPPFAWAVFDKQHKGAAIFKPINPVVPAVSRLSLRLRGRVQRDKSATLAADPTRLST